jgi:hypothetical protein
LFTGFGVSVERAESDWQGMKKTEPKKTIDSGYVGFEKYGYDPDSMKFVFLLYEPRDNVKINLSASAKLLQKPMLQAASGLVKASFGNGQLDSVFGSQVTQLTDFDKQFLRILYGKHVHSGMLLIKAKRLMYEELSDCFNAKAGNTKK